MFNVRRLSLLLLCADLFALQLPSIYHSRAKRELSERNDLPQKTDKMASSLNYADSSSNNGWDSKKTNNTLSRKKLFAHLTRFKRSDDNSEENLTEEPYFRCTNNKCENGGSCFQKGSEFWCVCGPNFAGKWCETKRVPSVGDADCDKSTEYRLALALAIVILLFIFFIIVLIYWYKRRIPPWKNEKEEWNQLLKDRLDDGCQKKMPAPPLPPRRYLYSQQETHNGGSPEYISLTDIRKYVDDKDHNDENSSTKSTRHDNKRHKSARSTEKSTLQPEEKKPVEPPSDRNKSGNSADEVNLTGGYYHESAHAQLKIEPRYSESLNMDRYPENVTTNSERIPRETAWQKSLKAFALNNISSNGKTQPENQPLFCKSSCDLKERLFDKERNGP